MNHQLHGKGGSKIQLLHLIFVAILFLAVGSYLGGSKLNEKIAELSAKKKGDL